MHPSAQYKKIKQKQELQDKDYKNQNKINNITSV